MSNGKVIRKNSDQRAKELVKPASFPNQSSPGGESPLDPFFILCQIFKLPPPPPKETPTQECVFSRSETYILSPTAKRMVFREGSGVKLFLSSPLPRALGAELGFVVPLTKSCLLKYYIDLNDFIILLYVCYYPRRN
jgi:hypothetical protein